MGRSVKKTLTLQSIASMLGTLQAALANLSDEVHAAGTMPPGQKDYLANANKQRIDTLATVTRIESGLLMQGSWVRAELAAAGEDVGERLRQYAAVSTAHSKIIGKQQDMITVLMDRVAKLEQMPALDYVNSHITKVEARGDDQQHQIAEAFRRIGVLEAQTTKKRK